MKQIHRSSSARHTATSVMIEINGWCRGLMAHLALYSGRDGHYIPHPRIRDEVGAAAEYQPGLHDPESRQAALPRPHRHPPGHCQVRTHPTGTILNINFTFRFIYPPFSPVIYPQ